MDQDAEKAPPEAVTRAFGLRARPRWWEGRTWVAGDVFLKPVDDVEEARWTCEVLSRVDEDGFRVARPVAASDGSWVVEGWVASRRVVGSPAPGGSESVLKAARAFHAALREVPKPPCLTRRRHRWATADRVAWGEEPYAPSSWLEPRFSLLKSWACPVTLEPQIIHGDLSGNVLVAPGLLPAVIDFSPYWRPAAYAEAIIAVDAWLWSGAGFDVVERVVAPARSPGLLARAALFRLVALDLHAQLAPELAAEASTFDPVMAHIARLTPSR